MHITWFITLDHWHLTPASQAGECLPLAAADAEPTNQCAVGFNSPWHMCHVDLASQPLLSPQQLWSVMS